VGRRRSAPDDERDEGVPAWQGRLAFTRNADGRFEVHLTAPAREILASGADDLRDRILASAGQPGPLFPAAHPDRPDLEHDYQQLMGGDLVESRLAAIDVLEASLDSESVDESQLVRWMQTTNAMRLVLGEELGVSEDPVEIDPDDPDLPRHVFYELLGILVSHMVHALQEP
jgi:hypothetical protein